MRISSRVSWLKERPFENPGKRVAAIDPLMFNRTDFWTRIDVRDSAQAMEKSLTSDYEGCHTLFINDSHNCTGVPSLPLARLFFPEAEVGQERLCGTNALVSIDAARRLIGFEPEHSVEQWLYSGQTLEQDSQSEGAAAADARFTLRPRRDMLAVTATRRHGSKI
jgi:hypothetical protein